VVQADSSSQIATGQRRFRTIGSATAVLFMAGARGDKAVLDLADAVVAAFRGVKLASPEVTFVPAPSIVGPGDQTDGWYARVVRIPFRFDEVAA
jgi:hypothetical protein